jgi:DNA-binding SARP family transcriptional activator/pimeloyl-ACP methyl ester carboxylesterase
VVADVAVLGPVRVVVDDIDVTPRAVKERTLLAVLALRNGQAVTVDQLVEELWGDLDRDGGKHALQVRVAALRKTLDGAGASGLLRHVGGGYVLDVDDSRVDHLRFSVLVSQSRVQRSRGDLVAARDSLQVALDLWRGDALCDAVSSITVDSEARRLNDARIDALEDRIEVDLDLGRHREMAPELDRLVALHPLRERLWRHRILALYRSGRQAEALRAAHEVRQLLAELGLQPEPALRNLEAGVLEQRPELQWTPPAATVALLTPPIGYARSCDGVHLAYQVAGDGPVDMVIVPGYVSHLDTWWEAYSGKLVRRLAGFCRLILFDKRGTGLSDRPSGVGVDQWLTDVDTILEEVHSARPIVFGVSAGTAIAIQWAADHPDRVRGLIAYGGHARMEWSPDHLIGLDPAMLDAGVDRVEAMWATGAGLRAYCPSIGDDPSAREQFAQYRRKAASPGSASTYLRALNKIDVRPALPRVTVPTLVLHAAGDLVVHPNHARYTADHIVGARLTLLDSRDHLIFFSDAIDEIADAIETFVHDLTGTRSATSPAKRVSEAVR